MFTIPLLIKLSIIALLWSQDTPLTKMIMNIVPNKQLSSWISLTILLVLIHVVDVYYDRMKKEN